MSGRFLLILKAEQLSTFKVANICNSFSPIPYLWCSPAVWQVRTCSGFSHKWLYLLNLQGYCLQQSFLMALLETDFPQLYWLIGLRYDLKLLNHLVSCLMSWHTSKQVFSIFGSNNSKWTFSVYSILLALIVVILPESLVKCKLCFLWNNST